MQQFSAKINYDSENSHSDISTLSLVSENYQKNFQNKCQNKFEKKYCANNIGSHLQKKYCDNYGNQFEKNFYQELDDQEMVNGFKDHNYDKYNENNLLKNFKENYCKKMQKNFEQEKNEYCQKIENRENNMNIQNIQSPCIISNKKNNKQNLFKSEKIDFTLKYDQDYQNQEKESEKSQEKQLHFNPQNKQIQESLQKALNNFEIFIEQLGENKSSTWDMNYVKVNYKIEMQEIQFSSSEILAVYKRLFEKYLNRKYFIRKIWWEKELVIFLWILVNYASFHCKEFRQFSQSDWNKIADMLPLKTAEECQLKLLGLEKVSLQKIPWSQLEDFSLKKIICQKGSLKWAETSKSLHEMVQTRHFRSSKQCRERWNNYLNPKLKKGDWIHEEDIKLLQLAKLRGKRWAQISREMKGRNENTVKNRYNCLIKKALKQKKILKFANINSDVPQNFRLCQQEYFLIEELIHQKYKIIQNKEDNFKYQQENENIVQENNWTKNKNFEYNQKDSTQKIDFSLEFDKQLVRNMDDSFWEQQEFRNETFFEVDKSCEFQISY